MLLYEVNSYGKLQIYKLIHFMFTSSMHMVVQTLALFEDFIYATVYF